ncbi:hypothetical protein K440DRAFT_116717 [Wilcoxina mikolae CBS 423.85]|nr:hypothetical protein K440DRAFT_116717 [Wilcoxina mikolae CBS 423.85]
MSDSGRGRKGERYREHSSTRNHDVGESSGYGKRRRERIGSPRRLWSGRDDDYHGDTHRSSHTERDDHHGRTWRGANSDFEIERGDDRRRGGDRRLERSISPDRRGGDCRSERSSKRKDRREGGGRTERGVNHHRRVDGRSESSFSRDRRSVLSSALVTADEEATGVLRAELVTMIDQEREIDIPRLPY